MRIINCKSNKDTFLCTNKNVKRSLFGFGFRYCILEYNDEKECEHQKKYPKPNGSPPPPPPCPKLKITNVYDSGINTINKELRNLKIDVEKVKNEIIDLKLRSSIIINDINVITNKLQK